MVVSWDYGDVVIKWGFNGNITSDNGDLANDNIVTPQKDKNIPAEALPAYENDENDYFVTARSDFFHSKPLQKKGPSTL